jgi:hypothetical protein
MATLKNMTRVGADVRQIARLLQAKAPENHMLAYITPEEAQLLKDRGGSGMPDPETGIPSFQEEFTYDMYGEQATAQPYVPQYEQNFAFTEPATMPVYRGSNIETGPASATGVFSQPDYSSFMAPSVAAPQVGPVPEVSIGAQPTPDLFAVRGYGAGEVPVEDRSRRADLTDVLKPSDAGFMSRLSKATGMKEETLARLGLGGIQAIIGSRASRKAAEQGQRGRQDMEALAAPYLQKGAELQRQAQAGELTPVARQQLQVAQAQAAQAASSRGGVGAQQTAARVEAIRNQLLQQQSDYGMKLTSIGDQIALGAIRTGLQADQYANQLTSSYFNNIMRTLAGTPTVTQTTQTTTTGVQ